MPSPLIIGNLVSPYRVIGPSMVHMHVWNRFAKVRQRAASLVIAANFVVGICPMSNWAWRDGFRRMSLQMLPIVRYIGYAILLRKCISRVLSEEIMRGTTVAPGLRDLREAYGRN